MYRTNSLLRILCMKEAVVHSILRAKTFIRIDFQEGADQIRQIVVVRANGVLRSLATLHETHGLRTRSLRRPIDAPIFTNQLLSVLARLGREPSWEMCLKNGFDHRAMLNVVVGWEQHLTSVQLHQDASNTP